MPTHRMELGALEVLVERLRAEYSGSSRAELELVAQLDDLLVRYVDLGIELCRLGFGLGVTGNDAPRFALLDTDDAARSHRIARLRVRARNRCLARMRLLEREMANVGQLVRLVHEQSLTSRGSASELCRAVGEVLDDVERVWRARDEVEAWLESGPALAELE
jgi:hypothetical protein